MAPRPVLAALILLTALVLAPPDLLPAADMAKPPKPNILFIFSDDHSCQSIGAYRSWLSGFVREQKLTPHIDRLADQGVLFEQSFCGNSTARRRAGPRAAHAVR